mmetsp:Transcript_8755/g.17312  ORF Transcript_8755/g.17312 Transcript_8755/m.17312 type:complete len:264 (+) Transcript_8755:274-1065(+)
MRNHPPGPHGQLIFRLLMSRTRGRSFQCFQKASSVSKSGLAHAGEQCSGCVHTLRVLPLLGCGAPCLRQVGTLPWSASTPAGSPPNPTSSMSSQQVCQHGMGATFGWCFALRSCSSMPGMVHDRLHQKRCSSGANWSSQEGQQDSIPGTMLKSQSTHERSGVPQRRVAQRFLLCSPRAAARRFDTPALSALIAASLVSSALEPMASCSLDKSAFSRERMCACTALSVCVWLSIVRSMSLGVTCAHCVRFHTPLASSSGGAHGK